MRPATGTATAPQTATAKATATAMYFIMLSCIDRQRLKSVAKKWKRSYVHSIPCLARLHHQHEEHQAGRSSCHLLACLLAACLQPACLFLTCCLPSFSLALLVACSAPCPAYCLPARLCLPACACLACGPMGRLMARRLAVDWFDDGWPVGGWPVGRLVVGRFTGFEAPRWNSVEK